MSIKNKLRADLKDALRDRDTVRKSVIRMTLAAITNAEADARRDLADEALLVVLQKEAKKRRETIAELKKVDRPDLLAKEEAEMAVLEGYLPPQLSRDEIADVARGVIAELGATSMAQMGPVMGRLKPRIRGRADGRVAAEVVRELLSEP